MLLVAEKAIVLLDVQQVNLMDIRRAVGGAGYQVPADWTPEWGAEVPMRLLRRVLLLLPGPCSPGLE